MKRFFVIIVSILIYSSVSAQNTADIGIWGGVSSYIGDMTNIDKASSLNPNGGLYLRYNFNPRVNARAMAIFGPVGANGNFEEKPWEFDKFVTDFSIMGEFNFFRYIIGSKRYRATPYLMGGVGVSMFNYTSDSTDLSTVVFYMNQDELAKLSSDAQRELWVHKDGVIGFNIPIGFGFKFNVGKRLSVGFEGILRKYFNDKVDDLDDPRKFYTATDSTGQPIDGFWTSYNSALHNNDFTLHFGVHLTYQFYRGDRECPVYENIN